MIHVGERRVLVGLRDRLFTVRPRPHYIVRTGWPQYSCMNEADAQHSHEAMSYVVVVDGDGRHRLRG